MQHAVVDLPVLDEPPKGLDTWVLDHIFTTHSGNQMNLLQPNPGQIDIDDIAYAMSRLPLYNGHTAGPEIYSVAMRSCWVARYLQMRTGRTEIALHGLMHWSACAYMGLNVLPANRSLIEMELSIKQAIYKALDLPVLTPEHCDLISQAFHQAQIVELEALLPPGCVESENITASQDQTAAQLPWLEPIQPWMVCGAFLQFFDTLKRGEAI